MNPSKFLLLVLASHSVLAGPSHMNQDSPNNQESTTNRYQAPASDGLSDNYRNNIKTNYVSMEAFLRDWYVDPPIGRRRQLSQDRKDLLKLLIEYRDEMERQKNSGNTMEADNDYLVFWDQSIKWLAEQKEKFSIKSLPSVADWYALQDRLLEVNSQVGGVILRARTFLERKARLFPLLPKETALLEQLRKCTAVQVPNDNMFESDKNGSIWHPHTITKALTALQNTPRAHYVANAMSYKNVRDTLQKTQSPPSNVAAIEGIQWIHGQLGNQRHFTDITETELADALAKRIWVIGQDKKQFNTLVFVNGLQDLIPPIESFLRAHPEIEQQPYINILSRLKNAEVAKGPSGTPGAHIGGNGAAISDK